jgi:outer membrane immunogenic protein
MRYFRVLATTLFVAGAFSLSVSAAYAQGCVTANSGSNSARASSLVGGGQGGYNWQQGAFVYGLETDLSATKLNSSMSDNLALSTPSCPNDGASTSASIDWYGTVRGRAGWTAGQALFYGTGGLAYGRVGLNSTFSALGISTTADTSSIRTGWVAGAGIDYLLQPNLVLNFGYQYVDLGTVSLSSTAGSFVTQNASARAAFHTVTAGLSWRFAAANAGPKGMWSGAYLGGHGGGAWGNTTNADYTSGFLISDARLKRDITLVARLDDGLGLYQYRYLWSDTIYVGVMAQEVALMHPDAIVRSATDDYLRVDYSRLGLKLMTLPEWEAQKAL